MICDFAETYHILDYRGLPLDLVATLAVGLRGNSRVMMRISGTEHPLETFLLAGCLDKLSYLFWAKTKDGYEGINPPKSVLDALSGKTEEKRVSGFDSPEDFMAEWSRLAKGTQ